MNEQALNFGRWLIYKKILFARMGSKMKQKLENLQSRIDLQRGMAHQFLVHRRSVNEARLVEESKSNNATVAAAAKEALANDNIVDTAMESILQTVIDLIQARKPISDDVLLICLRVYLLFYRLSVSLSLCFCMLALFIIISLFVLTLIFIWLCL